MIITLGNYTTRSHHVTAGIMPTLHNIKTATRTCKHPKCATCTHLNCNTYFKSTTTGIQYPLRHSFTCASSNIIYLITCMKCKKQYVGLTTTQLNQRTNRHRTNIINDKTIYIICIHFNFPDHKLSHVSVQAIDTAPTIQELKRLEQFCTQIKLMGYEHWEDAVGGWGSRQWHTPTHTHTPSVPRDTQGG